MGSDVGCGTWTETWAGAWTEMRDVDRDMEWDCDVGRVSDVDCGLE